MDVSESSRFTYAGGDLYYDHNTGERVSRKTAQSRLQQHRETPAQGFTETRSSTIQLQVDAPKAEKPFPDILPNVAQLPGEEEGVKILPVERISSEDRENAVSQINDADANGYFLNSEEAKTRVEYVLKAETRAQLLAITKDLKPREVSRKWHQQHLMSGQQGNPDTPAWMKKAGGWLKALFTFKPLAYLISFGASTTLMVMSCLTFFTSTAKHVSGGAIAAGVILCVVGAIWFVITLASAWDELDD